MQRRKEELAELGETALKQLRGPVLTGLRKKLASWRDPRARLLRQRKRAKATTATGAITTGTFGVGSFVTISPESLGLQVSENLGTMLDLSGFGLGGLAVLTGAGTIGAGIRYRRLKRTPLPEAPPEPVDLPPQDSEAHEPMRRLQDAEQSLHRSLMQLTAAGVAHSVADTRATADGAAQELRQLAARLQAVESALPHAPEPDKETLRADVRELRRELDEGVDGYGGLVAATSRAVAASGAPEQKDLLQDATDRLAGLASALRELSGSTRSSTGSAETSGSGGGQPRVSGDTGDAGQGREAERN